ncbi:PIG-L family deacetylase [Jatrophihabitans sp. YIM 134969]
MPPRPPYDDDPMASGLTAWWNGAQPTGRAPRVLGLFAHPDDEVFCAGGALALAGADGADTAVVSLTRGEAGQIRDAAAATRRTLGVTRARELERSAAALGVGHVECLDLGDGRLASLPGDELVRQVRQILARLVPDVVVTFDDDGGFGHPDHVLSARAVLAARDDLDHRPTVVRARFPRQDRLLLDLLVDWLGSGAQRSSGSEGFGHALRLFADGSTMLGFAADHLQVQWFPAGSYVIEQGEPATELFCVLGGSADVVVEAADGTLRKVDTVTAGAFVGQDGIATSRPRNAHVIAREDLTCFVLAPHGRDLSAGRGTGAVVTAPAVAAHHLGDGTDDPPTGIEVAVDVRGVVDRKIAALVAHRSQYALDPGLLPRQVLEPLLGTEHFVVVA